MILSNPSTQEIIIINKINRGILYTHYENAHYKNKNIGENNAETWSLDKSLTPDALLTFEENEFKLAYNYLLGVQKFAGFEITEDNQAWTNVKKPLRIFINNDEIMKSMEEKDPFNDIIERLILENKLVTDKFIIRGKTQTVLYLENILSKDSTVVSEKLDISLWTETKK